MDLVNLLDNEIILAMKEKNKLKLDTLRIVKAGLKQKLIDKKIEINDSSLIDVVSYEIKTRSESIKEFEKGNRIDLIEKTNNEIEILKKFLPKQLTENEIIKIIDKVFESVKPEGIKDMGKIMKEITPLIKGKADLGNVSNIIRDKLNNIN